MATKAAGTLALEAAGATDKAGVAAAQGGRADGATADHVAPAELGGADSEALTKAATLAGEMAEAERKGKEVLGREADDETGA